MSRTNLIRYDGDGVTFMLDQHSKLHSVTLNIYTQLDSVERTLVAEQTAMIFPTNITDYRKQIASRPPMIGIVKVITLVNTL